MPRRSSRSVAMGGADSPSLLSIYRCHLRVPPALSGSRPTATGRAEDKPWQRTWSRSLKSRCRFDQAVAARIGSCTDVETFGRRLSLELPKSPIGADNLLERTREPSRFLFFS